LAVRVRFARPPLGQLTPPAPTLDPTARPSSRPAARGWPGAQRSAISPVGAQRRALAAQVGAQRRAYSQELARRQTARPRVSTSFRKLQSAPRGGRPRDPAPAICAHPRLGEIRDDGCRDGRGLWRHRAHSAPNLMAIRPLGRGSPTVPPAGITDKGKSATGDVALSGLSLYESSVVGDHIPPRRDAALQRSKRRDAFQSSVTGGGGRALHVIIRCVA
jgi:hypothetical protein